MAQHLTPKGSFRKAPARFQFNFQKALGDAVGSTDQDIRLIGVNSRGSHQPEIVFFFDNFQEIF
jgi:hypothetical protein